MGRVAVQELLSTHPTMVAAGMSPETVWPNFAMDRAPRVNGVWLVVRYGANLDRFGRPGGIRALTIWAYQSRAIGTDYAAIDDVLKAVTDVLGEATHYLGSDGSVLRMAEFMGYSADLVDAGYDAIARNADFRALMSGP